MSVKFGLDGPPLDPFEPPAPEEVVSSKVETRDDRTELEYMTFYLRADTAAVLRSRYPEWKMTELLREIVEIFIDMDPELHKNS